MANMSKNFSHLNGFACASRWRTWQGMTVKPSTWRVSMTFKDSTSVTSSSRKSWPISKGTSDSLLKKHPPTSHQMIFRWETKILITLQPLFYFRHSNMSGVSHGEIMNNRLFKAQVCVIYQSKTIYLCTCLATITFTSGNGGPRKDYFLFQPDQTGRLCVGRMPLPSETYTYDQVEGSHQKFSYMRVQIIRRVNSEQRKQSVSFW